MASCAALLGARQPNHITTPVGQNNSTDTTITVVDPRHSLYGQSFQIINKVNRPDEGFCYVVRLSEGTEKYVPEIATNLSPVKLSFPAIPLDIVSLQKLLTAYACMYQQLKEGKDYAGKISATTNKIKSKAKEFIKSKSEGRGTNSRKTSLANSQQPAERKDPSENSESLLHLNQIQNRSKRSSRGEK